MKNVRQIWKYFTRYVKGMTSKEHLFANAGLNDVKRTLISYSMLLR